MLHRTTAAIVGLAVCLLASAGVVHTQTKSSIPLGASLFIAPMANDLDGYIRAELVKQHVALKVVLKLEDAHLVLTGASDTRKPAWHEGWLTLSRDQATGSAIIVDRASKDIIWADQVGDNSFWSGPGGPRRVASRLVNDIRNAIVATASLPPPPPVSEEERAALNASRANVVTSPGAAPAVAMKGLTNEDILKLCAAGVGEDVILARIEGGPCTFRLEADDIVALKKSGVSDRLLAAMIRASSKK